jgi:hypothetical protein
VGAYVILVTGSRFFDDIDAIKTTLDQAVTDAVTAGAAHLILRHGACYPPVDPGLRRRPFRSGDYLAHLWWQRWVCLTPLPVLAGLTVLEEQARPANWSAPCRPACNQRTHHGRNVDHRRVRDGRSTCPMAGHHRNTDMVLEAPQPTVGIAFHRDNSTGTAHCTRIMREFSIPVLQVPYRPQGAHP